MYSDLRVFVMNRQTYVPMNPGHQMFKTIIRQYGTTSNPMVNKEDESDYIAVVCATGWDTIMVMGKDEIREQE